MRRSYRLVVDQIACDGHGVCAELFPERIELDPWGYPLLTDEPVSPGLLAHAERAVAACPRLALHLIEVPPPRSTRVPARDSTTRRVSR
jgi:ferredoxin